MTIAATWLGRLASGFAYRGAHIPRGIAAARRVRMIEIESVLLRIVTGGQQTEFANEARQQISGLTRSDGTPVSDFVCWDNPANSDYRNCVPAAQADSPGGRGNPWFIPKSFIAKSSG